MKVLSYTVHIEPSDEGGYWSRVPALPGCFSQGDTVEDTITSTKDAIELYLKDETDAPEESESSISVRIPITW